MSAELSALRIASARLESDAKDATITLEATRERVAELQRDLEEQSGHVQDLRKRESREKEEEKEKRKQEMLSEMMAKIDMVSCSNHFDSELIRNRVGMVWMRLEKS
jgi:kinesin family protein 5